MNTGGLAVLKRPVTGFGQGHQLETAEADIMALAVDGQPLDPAFPRPVSNAQIQRVAQRIKARPLERFRFCIRHFFVMSLYLLPTKIPHL